MSYALKLMANKVLRPVTRGWRGGRTVSGRGGRTRSAHPAQVGPGVHRHQRVPDPPDHARQPGQTLWNPPVRDGKTAAFTPHRRTLCSFIFWIKIKDYTFILIKALHFLNVGGQNQVSETNQGQSWRFLRPCTKSFSLAIIPFLNGFFRLYHLFSTGV